MEYFEVILSATWCPLILFTKLHISANLWVCLLCHWTCLYNRTPSKLQLGVVFPLMGTESMLCAQVGVWSILWWKGECGLARCSSIQCCEPWVQCCEPLVPGSGAVSHCWFLLRFALLVFPTFFLRKKNFELILLTSSVLLRSCSLSLYTLSIVLN